VAIHQVAVVLEPFVVSLSNSITCQLNVLEGIFTLICKVGVRWYPIPHCKVGVR